MVRVFFFFFKIFIFREREGEREGEKQQCVVGSRVPPTGDLVHNPGMCPDWELNWQPFGWQTGTQTPEQHQPGPLLFFLIPTWGHVFWFRQRGRRREEEREKEKPWLAATHIRPYRGFTGHLGTCPEWGSNLQPFGVGMTLQPAEPHGLGAQGSFCCVLSLGLWQALPEEELNSGMMACSKLPILRKAYS